MNPQTESTLIILSFGAELIVEIIVKFVAYMTFEPLMGTSKILTSVGKLELTNSSTAGVDSGSHLQALVCSSRCMAMDWAANE